VSDWRAYDLLYDLYVMNADGSDLKLLLGGPFFSPWLTYYFQPAWSPDGGTIALNVCPYAWDNCFPDSTVALVNADGSGLRSIASAGGYAHPSWSPDGTIIAFGSSACRECPSNIQYVTRNGSGSGVLVWDAHSPTWRPSTGGQLASPDGTTVPTATQIIDNSGAIWTLGSNAAVLRNGAQVGGAWASTIYWKTSTIYVYGLDLNWWQWTGSTWVNLGPAMPGGATGGTGSGTTSPDGTMIPTTASQIVDAAGAVWSLGSNTAVLRNGAQVGGAWASRILWKTSTIHVYGLDLNWWQWTGSTWVNLGPTMPGGTTGGNGSGTPSPDNTTVPTNASQIVDTAGAVWTLGSNTAVLRNGVQVAGAWASTIYWKNSTLYVYGLDLNWWQWTGSGWLNVGPLQP